MINVLVVMAGFVVLGALSLAGIGMTISALTRTNEIDERVVRLEELLEEDSGRHERKE